MTASTPSEVNALLQANGPGATVYLIGAGGCGMSGLGHLFLDLGYKVVGSDLVENEAARQLRGRGAEIHLEHLCARIQAARPFMVVYSSAIPPANPELVAAQRLQIPAVRRGVALASLLSRQRGVCIAGMHGKTTTAALTVFALEQLQAELSYAIGALVPQLSTHARFFSHRRPESPNSQPYFVVEADESDGTLGDFTPEHAIILNLDEEHFDYFAGIDSVCREFQRFAAHVSGRLVYCADDPRLASLFARSPNAVSYGFQPQAQYRIEGESDAGARVGCQVPGVTRFKLGYQGGLLGEFAISLVGKQNISNAAAVIALLHQLQFEPSAVARAIRSFQGAERRQQQLYHDERLRVFDDYGHHPTEIRATLQALREFAPQRLLVAFQPHRFSRTQHLLPEFATCFEEADRLWLTEIYPASERPIAGVTSAVLAEAIRRHGQKVEYVPALDQLCAQVQTAVASGDCVLFLGAGDITKAAHEFAAQMRQEALRRRESLALELSRSMSPGSVVRRDERLAKRTTLRVGGRADLYVEPASEADLAAALQFCAEHALPFLMLGRGSNLLVRDCGIRGLVISLAHPQFSRVEVHRDELRCGAGAKLKAVAVAAKRHSLSGLEFLEGIPGSVGGALRMNAGAMGCSMFEVVESVRFMDFAGRIRERKVDEVEVKYRNCPLLKNHIALSTVLKGHPAAPEVIASKMNACSQKRWSSQPAAPSAGCIFKNPAAIPAGRLIEELGLKGTRVGGAVISDVHGNFIVTEGGATAEDVLRLIDLVKERARLVRGVELETEVEIVGEVAPCQARSEDLGSIEQDCHAEANT